MPIRVVNIWKHHRSPDETRVYIGRTCRGYPQSPLANPWKVEGDRGETLERYREWLRQVLRNSNSAQAQEVMRLGRLLVADADLVLMCWCAPSPCHGAIVAEVVQKVANRLRGSSPGSPA